MPRPTIDHLLDSTIRIWRPVAVDDNALAVEERVYVPVSEVRAKQNRNVTGVSQVSGGMAPTGKMRWYGRPDIDVRVRDVCEVIEGPDAGLTWEVDGEPSRPKAHHTQVECVEWTGVLVHEEEPPS